MRKQIYHTILAVSMMTLAIAASGTAQQVEEMTIESPQELINKMAYVYSSCKSYKDEGVVTTIFFGDDGRQRTVKKPFTTAFVRPDPEPVLTIAFRTWSCILTTISGGNASE